MFPITTVYDSFLNAYNINLIATGKVVPILQKKKNILRGFNDSNWVEALKNTTTVLITA